jgi:predicted outer membrane protein
MDTTTTMSTNMAPLDKMDQDFVMKAASGGMMEVELGNMAQQNASSQRVKDFGSMMVRDHSKANDELMSFASRRNLMPIKKKQGCKLSIKKWRNNVPRKKAIWIRIKQTLKKLFFQFPGPGIF